MYAIISKLDPESSTIVSNLWRKLRECCGLSGIYKTPIPHFTWFAAEELEIDKISSELSQMAEDAEPFTIHTFGLGIFSGQDPILYLPMVKSIKMINLHCQMWHKFEHLSDEPNLYYSPKLWVPHITIAFNDLTHENLCCAIDAVAFEPIELFITVDNLNIAKYNEERPGEILQNFYFDAKRE